MLTAVLRHQRLDLIEKLLRIELANEILPSELGRADELLHLGGRWHASGLNAELAHGLVGLAVVLASQLQKLLAELRGGLRQEHLMLGRERFPSLVRED